MSNGRYKDLGGGGPLGDGGHAEGRQHGDERRSDREFRGKREKSREAFNIQFAQGLDCHDLCSLLQYELLRARDKGGEVVLPCAVVHDIKFRLRFYRNEVGEVVRSDTRRTGPHVTKIS